MNATTRIIFWLLLLVIQTPAQALDEATLDVLFPDLSGVKVEVFVSDGMAGSVSQNAIATAWQLSDAAHFVLPPATYDVRVRQGGASRIIDAVDCNGGSCSVKGLTARLSVTFTGMRYVHTYVKVSDGTLQVAGGDAVTQQTWQNDQASIAVLRGLSYDLLLQQGAAAYVVDNVACDKAQCGVDNVAAALTVDFTGMRSVHTYVVTVDGVNGKANGDAVTSMTYQNDQALLAVFRQVYDIRVVQGAAERVADAVDCRTGTCKVTKLTSLLTVKFPGMKGVHTYVRNKDRVIGRAGKLAVTQLTYQNDQAVLTVLRGRYDLLLQKGAAEQVVDAVDCLGAACVVDDLTANLLVVFNGLNSVHTFVTLPDDVKGSAAGDAVTYLGWQNDQAQLVVFRQVYDVQIQHAAAQRVIDNVDCTSGSCKVAQITAQLTVNFPGMKDVHSYVRSRDKVVGKADGEPITQQKWKSDLAELTVLRGRYDLLLQKGAAELVLDDVDCRRAQCTVDDLTANLTVQFEGLNGVHTYVTTPDGLKGSVNDQNVTALGWQNDRATLVVFRQIYDVQVKHNAAQRVVDNIDCTSGACRIARLTAQMTVNFQGMNGVHTHVRVPDGVVDAADGGGVTSQTWNKDQSLLTVLRNIYDVEVVHGGANHIVDKVNCLSATCLVEGITAQLNVRFPGMNAVHTHVKVVDGQDGAAGGAAVTSQTWRKNYAALTVLRNRYDIQLQKGAAVLVADNVDCRQADCTVAGVTADLTVKFPGLLSVHTEVRLPDDIADTSDGELVTALGWQDQSAVLTVFRQTYDVRVQHQALSIFDRVDCTSGTCRVLVTGNSQLTLLDGIKQISIAKIKVRAYEKNPDGTLVYLSHGITNSKGNIHFTLPGLGTGRTFVYHAENPLNDGKHYYSPFVRATGPQTFAVTSASDTSLDLHPPLLTISSHQDGDLVGDIGFTLSGSASDDRRIEEVLIRIPINGTLTTLTADYSSASQRWEAAVPGAWLVAGQPLPITVMAIDQAHNETVASLSVNPIHDVLGPQIKILSHSALEQVPSSGFLLSGKVSDETEIASLSATLDDPILGMTVTDKTLDFDTGSGAWTLAVLNGQISEGAVVRITLSATDTSGNLAQRSIKLQVVAADLSTRHMISRITFGATPELIEHVTDIGTLSFLDEQLSPDTIDDSAFDSRINGAQPLDTHELQAWTLLHMIYSKRQLQEVMTWFWDNHFNTDIRATRFDADRIMVSNQVDFEVAENQAFRANALGNFRDLLDISAKSPAMLIYLDSISNVVEDSNENYTRELLELHTMGVDGGYMHHDIEGGAEIFTGWHLRNGQFFFDASRHNFSDQHILGVHIPAGGQEQGEQMLDIISRHPSTAGFICNKLVTLLVSDEPPSSLVARCAERFLQTTAAPDQIAKVLRLILTSPEFFDAALVREKIKTPLEFVVGAVRNLDAETDATDLPAAISQMGIALYENSRPTGWSEIGADWINASLMVERIKWVNRLVRQEASAASWFDPIVYFSSQGYQTADGVVGFLLETTLGDLATELSRQQALDLLNGQYGFQLSDPDAEPRLRQTSGAVLSYPDYQFQ